MIKIEKLAAIYNVFDGEELLQGSIERVMNHVDLIIIVFQNISNFGEPYTPMANIDLSGIDRFICPIIFDKYTPVVMGGFVNEQNKRNIGITIARREGCSHFLHLDVDEYYEDFAQAKQEYISLGVAGAVCPIYTYFKKPTWRLKNLDHYYVPFIHHLKDHTQAGHGFNGKFYCDPTRVINEADMGMMTTPMHHYSWVRSDIKRKARNSSAGQHGNQLRGLLDAYDYLKNDTDLPGFKIQDMNNQELIVTENLFGIPEFLSV